MPIHADERPFEIKLTCEEARLDLNLNLDVLGLRMHAAHRDRAWWHHSPRRHQQQRSLPLCHVYCLSERSPS